MIEYNPALLKTPPYRHQAGDTKLVLKHKDFALFSEMGSGKSKVVVDAACALHEAGQLNLVVVVAPASCRRVWHNPEVGQIWRHAWSEVDVYEWHQKRVQIWDSVNGSRHPLVWLIINYEFIRPRNRDETRQNEILAFLKPHAGKFMLVLDESSAVKAHDSGQHESCMKLRELAGRCVILNGTPGNPLEVYCQFEVMNPDILKKRYNSFFHFRRVHCELVQQRAKGRTFEKIVGWKNMDLFHRLTKPHCVRHLKKDCLDLPEKIGGIDNPSPIFREIPLSASTWRMYRQLRREAILALPDRDIIPEPNALTRILRLAQLTSGHVTTPGTLDDEEAQSELFAPPEVTDVSDEKLSWALDHLLEWSSAEATVVWCRWIRERERLAKMLRDAGVTTYEIHGGQKPKERAAAELAFLPESRGQGRRVLVAQPHAGGKGLDLAAATEAVYLSNSSSLEYRLQSEDRLHRATTINRVTYLDALATGPEGQKTIDHLQWDALRAKNDLATWTCSAWRHALKREEAQG